MFHPFGVALTSGLPRLIRQLAHWFRASVILAGGVFISSCGTIFAAEGSASSCGTTVSLKGLKEYVGQQPPPSRVVAWRGDSREQSYQFQKQDVVRFSSESDKTLTVEPYGEYVQPSYSINRKTASLPIWVIQDAESIKISAGDQSVIVCVSKPSADKYCIDGKGIDLSESKAAAILESSISTAWLKAEVIPIDPGLVLPGDDVQIEISYDLHLGDTILKMKGHFLQTIRSRSTVQADGSISVPRLGFVSPLLENANDSGTPANAYRAIAAATEADESRIIVWPPNDEQIPLWQIARCLNRIERHKPQPPLPPPPTASLPAPECLTARIDDRFNPIQDIYQWQRYALEPGPRTWTLVDVNGRAYQLPFQYGRSVEEAVTRLYPRKTGHDLNVDRLGPYVTVLPSPESREEPFYGLLKRWQAMVTKDGRGSKKAASTLSRIALRAGDTVIVSRSSPQTGY